jgi:hypothetical protein
MSRRVMSIPTTYQRVRSVGGQRMHSAVYARDADGERRMLMPAAVSERGLQRDIQLACAEVKGLRLWRANVGRGWVSEGKPTVQIVGGKKIVTLVNAQPLASLPEGFPDLFGFIVPEEHIGPHAIERGQAVPVFIEVKTPTGRVSPKQQVFIDAARAAGCRAGIARSVGDALKIVRGEM